MAKTWQVILATIVIFVAGLVTGGATALGVVRWVVRHRGMNPPAFGMAGQRAGPMMGFGPQLMRNLENRLELTADQKARIAPIVERTATELSQNRREVQQRSAAAIERMQGDVAPILTPEQLVKFDDLIAKQRARFQQFRRGFPQGPAPGEAPPGQGPPK